MNLVEDEIVSACIYHNDASQLLVISDQCAMKRIKLADIDLTGRPTKGSMVCKKLKAKPYQIRYIGLYDMNDEIIISNSEIHRIIMKDISLMSKDATFSTPLPATSDFFMIQPMQKVAQHELPISNQEIDVYEEIDVEISE